MAWTPAVWAAVALAVAVLPSARGQPSVCGRVCKSDVQCGDTRAICTYCTNGRCKPPTTGCGGGPKPSNTTKPQLLAIGDSISIGWAPVLFPMLSGYESQHDPVNAGPASKGFECVRTWVGLNSTPPHQKWDTVLFNFGLHSLDNPPTGESESIAQYSTELRAIGNVIKNMSRKVIFVSTTPVPLNVTVGPGRHNRDVIRFNAAAAGVMESLAIPVCNVYAAVMQHCPNTTGPPDFTYANCSLQSPGGVHFPGHYDVLADTLYTCVTGTTPPPTPQPTPPLSCDALEAEYCPNAGKGTGQKCQACYVGHKEQLAPCVAPFLAKVPKLLHPQMAFVDCYCFGMQANCTTLE